MKEELYPVDPVTGWPHVTDDTKLQVEYERMRAAGTGHNTAEMLVFREPPACNTEREFQKGRFNNNQFENCPKMGLHYKAIADKAGIATTGKQYIHGLGRFSGDPLAWVRTKGEVLDRVKALGVSCSGLVEHRGRPKEEVPDVPLAADIWEREANAVLAENPDMRYADAKEKAFNMRTNGLVTASEQAIITPAKAVSEIPR